VKSETANKVGCHLIAQLKLAITQVKEIEKVNLADNHANGLVTQNLNGFLEQMRMTKTTINTLRTERPFTKDDFPDYEDTIQEVNELQKKYGFSTSNHRM